MSNVEEKVIELGHKYVHKCSPFNKSLHVSVIMRGDFFITYGVNHESYSDPYAFGYQNNSIHSEYDLIKRFKRKFPIQRSSECELWNMRLTRKFELRNSKPCTRCTKLLSKSYVRKIYYSTDEGIFDEV
jgi:hypothetical protein